MPPHNDPNFWLNATQPALFRQAWKEKTNQCAPSREWLPGIHANCTRQKRVPNTHDHEDAHVSCTQGEGEPQRKGNAMYNESIRDSGITISSASSRLATTQRSRQACVKLRQNYEQAQEEVKQKSHSPSKPKQKLHSLYAKQGSSLTHPLPIPPSNGTQAHPHPLRRVARWVGAACSAGAAASAAAAAACRVARWGTGCGTAATSSASLTLRPRLAGAAAAAS